MGKEIERKFLVIGEGWRADAVAFEIRQGYLANAPDLAVRVRTCGDRAYLTVKSGKRGLTRAEYEYEIPVADAEEMLDGLCARPLIEKTRHRLEYGGRTWVVDVFAGDNAGLRLAEVEFDDEGDTIDLPEWVGEEVSDDPRYLNANLVSAPFRSWDPAGR